MQIIRNHYIHYSVKILHEFINHSAINSLSEYDEYAACSAQCLRECEWPVNGIYLNYT